MQSETLLKNRGCITYRRRDFVPVALFRHLPPSLSNTTPMSEYPGQDLSLEQLFYAVNAKILKQAQIYQSSVPGPGQQRWVSTRASEATHSSGLTMTIPSRFLGR